MEQLVPQPSQNPFRQLVQTPTGEEPIPLGSGSITRLLGKGGMASVYEIWNPQLEVCRAVKLMHPNCSNEALQRFQTEIKITAKIHHPNIIEIHGVGIWNNLPFIEMEKAHGVTLEALIRERGALPVEVCLAIGILVARALNYAHNHEYMLYKKSYHGVIHRDLKPGNIMVSTYESIKLMDFGIARPTDASFHTVDGTVVGTLQYLSPEQLQGHPLDIRTDIYSLGTCLYEAACGNYAFPEANITRLLADKAKNRYRPLKDYSIDIPERFVKIIHQCMHNDRNVRPQTAAILGEDLEHLLRKITQEKAEEVIAYFMNSEKSTRITVIPLYRISVKAILAALLLITIGIVGVVIVSRSSPKQNSSVSRTIPQISISDTLPEETLKSGESDVKKSVQTTHIPSNPAKTTTNTTAPDSQKAQLETLYTKHNTHDLLQIMQIEMNSGNTSTVLKIYDNLPSKIASESVAIILKMRALKKNNSKSLAAFLDKVTVLEGEILFSQALNAYSLGKIIESENLLEKAIKAPRELISYEALSKDVFYLRARIATQKFDKNPNDINWKVALEAWYNVKKEMRSQQTHTYYTLADREIARIGQKFRTAAR